MTIDLVNFWYWTFGILTVVFAGFFYFFSRSTGGGMWSPAMPNYIGLVASIIIYLIAVIALLILKP